MGESHVLYAILAEDKNKTYIVGIAMHNFEGPCIHSKREIIEQLWQFVSPEVRKKTRIAKMVEERLN